MKKASAILVVLAISAAAFAQNAKLRFTDGEELQVDFYSPNIVRLFHDPSGGPMREPQAVPPASILVNNARKAVIPFEKSVRYAASNEMRVSVSEDGLITITYYGEKIIRDARITHENGKTVFSFSDSQGYYFGGGVQNGRFSHKGNTIAIENQNSWTDGGVCSPAPWFWSTGGYGILWNSFDKGSYSFGDTVVLEHDTPLLDIFIMVDETPEKILQDYYQLTGAPVLLPKFAFFEGHLNAYNRDYWLEGPDGILFEDGRRYKESQSDNGGIRESLNGELPGNYQFSARAVIDRYEAADMPLGWILPNDGYGAGYGQTETLDGNIDNLRLFGDYARSKGVEIGLWTQSDLHPVDSIPALLQRDIDKEIGVAGVRVLKTDVAWVYRGYSFGLNGIADAASIMAPHARPFIITLDGWAGTHRYGGIWTGDQSGGQWEYIRFHIPTYICAGLSGQPNIGSDIDGIFGGRNELVNIRDFQWKTFTPMELNMDGWGANEKYPQALGSRAAEINRRYLKLKSELMPYTYSIAWEATHGLPMVRAMFLEDPNDFTYGTATQYQFMYGPWFLVAPVYQETAVDADGNDIRDNIYLPEGEWIDWFTGEAYAGGRVLCNYPAPLDRLPVFVKRGAIIPMAAPHNNPSLQNRSERIYEIFPFGESHFTEYDDDGVSCNYLTKGEGLLTGIDCKQKGKTVTINVGKASGKEFSGIVREKTTVFRIHTMGKPSGVKAWVNGKKVKADVAWAGGIATVTVPACDIMESNVKVQLCGFKAPSAAHPASSRVAGDDPFETFAGPNSVEFRWGTVTPSAAPSVTPSAAPSVTPSAAEGSREIFFNGLWYTGITRDSFTIEGLQPDTDYTFSVRMRNGNVKEFKLRTAKDPYEFAIKGIVGTCTAPTQGGQEIDNLFDGSTSSEVWHTRWYEVAVPFDVTADLGLVYTLDKLEYVPRSDAGNGTILRGTLRTSVDGKEWTLPSIVAWERTAASKFFEFKGIKARYIKLHVDTAVGGFGSGRELFIYKVPGTDGFSQGVFNDKGEAVESVD